MATHSNGPSAGVRLAGVRRWSWRAALDLIATLAIIGAAAALIVRSGPPMTPTTRAQATPPIPTDPVSLDGAPVLGRADAKVVMLEFSDFQCPYCAKFVHEVLPELKAKYIDTGRLQLVFRHLPLPIHPRAERAAETAVCADQQHRFWPMHGALFASAGKLEDADLATDARTAGVAAAEFDSCLHGPIAARVKADVDLARALKLSGTPSFLIGVLQADGRLRVRQVVVGARPIADFAAPIDSVLRGGN